MTTVVPAPAEGAHTDLLAPATRADWMPCTQQAHVDKVRVRHEDVATNPNDRGAQAALWEAVGELLNHMDGLHADDCAVELIVHAVSEPDRYERERMGVWEWMASFTTRPVKAGLPTLFELQQADAEDRHRMQLIALVAIADELAEAVDQLKEEA